MPKFTRCVAARAPIGRAPALLPAPLRSCTRRPPSQPGSRASSPAPPPWPLQAAQAQLLQALQQHGWLWELLLRLHLHDLLRQPGAACLLADALARLPAATQARAYRVWREQLGPQAPAPPPPVLQLLLEQLKACFRAQAPDHLPLFTDAAGDADGAPGEQQQEPAAAAAGQADTGASPVCSEVRVALREQLPHLLQLLLALTCGSQAAPPAEAGSEQQQGGSSGRASANMAQDRPSLSSVQSAAAAGRPRARGAAAQQRLAAAAAASSSSGGAGGGGGGASGSLQDAVLWHAVVLIGRLSEPDALHGMLGICAPRSTADGHGDDSGSEDEAAAAQRQAPLPSWRDVQRARTAAALIEACLDGMLTLPPLAAAVHTHLHSKGSSSPAAAAGGAAQGAAAAAAAPDEEQPAAAAAVELRHTVGLMLGMHKELTRFQLERTQQPGGPSACCAGSAAPWFGWAL